MEAIFDATREQIEIIRHPAQVKVPVCGRRWGKTVMMAIYLAVASLEWSNCTVWYVSQRYARSLKMMRIMGKSPAFMELVRRPSSQFPPRFEMKNGSEIGFVSADRPDDLKGEGLRLICLDEGAIQTKHLFENVLYPMILDSDGTILVGSTYNGRNWFYDLAQKGLKNEDQNIKTWVYPTSTGIQFRGERGRERLEKFKNTISPMVWRQECECEPLAMVDAVFYYVDQCITKTLPLGPSLINPERGMQYVLAQDIGKDVDPSGVVVQELESGKVVHAEIYPLHTPHKTQAQRTLQLAGHFNNALICLDTTGGGEGGNREPFIQEYAQTIKYFEAVTFTMDTKRAMVRLLCLEFEKQRTSIPENFTELISQLKLYRYKLGETAIQPTFYGRPDDLVAAMLMCSFARKKGWKPPRSGNTFYGMGTY